MSLYLPEPNPILTKFYPFKEQDKNGSPFGFHSLSIHFAELKDYLTIQKHLLY